VWSNGRFRARTLAVATPNPVDEVSCGATGDRTPDLRIANAALSQLSYCPECVLPVTPDGLGPAGNERAGGYASTLGSQAIQW
jgi:hypothetical protein